MPRRRRPWVASPAQRPRRGRACDSVQALAEGSPLAALVTYLSGLSPIFRITITFSVGPSSWVAPLSSSPSRRVLGELSDAALPLRRGSRLEDLVRLDCVCRPRAGPALGHRTLVEGSTWPARASPRPRTLGLSAATGSVPLDKGAPGASAEPLGWAIPCAIRRVTFVALPGRRTPRAPTPPPTSPRGLPPQDGPTRRPWHDAARSTRQGGRSHVLGCSGCTRPDDQDEDCDEDETDDARRAGGDEERARSTGGEPAGATGEPIRFTMDDSDQAAGNVLAARENASTGEEHSHKSREGKGTFGKLDVGPIVNVAGERFSTIRHLQLGRNAHLTSRMSIGTQRIKIGATCKVPGCGNADGRKLSHDGEEERPPSFVRTSRRPNEKGRSGPGGGGDSCVEGGRMGSGSWWGSGAG